jgi:tetratricopeptide (TPR) repeat protein
MLGDYGNALSYNKKVARFPGSESSEMRRLSFQALITHRQGNSAHAYGIAEQVPQPVTKYALRVVLTVRGHILLSLGRLEEAREAYEQAVAEWEALDLAFLAVEPLSGLAQIAYQQQDFAEAVSFVDTVLQRLENPVALGESFDPFQVYLTCIRILQAVQDDRAESVLHAAYTDLMARADNIEDETLRRSFLENVPENREIIAIYEEK